MADEQKQDAPPPQRAAVYIDGFNLYHAVVGLKEPFLKWCDLWRLSQILSAPYDLEKVVFCTAMPNHLPDSLARHQSFNNAQVSKGVTVIKGHYIYAEDQQKYTEKQSDINVSLSLIMDGIDDVYDWAFLVSADSDQAATARVFKERMPLKRLAIVAPPDRDPPTSALPYADRSFTITKFQMEQAVLPAYVQTAQDRMIRRPPAYDPPEGWLHPDSRPKRKR